MKSLLKRIWNDKRGNVLVIVGASLPLLVGSAGLATDTIQWTLAKRQLQRAADSAALAGVHSLIQGKNHETGATRDLAINDHSGMSPTADVDKSPTGYSSDPYAVGVTLSASKDLGFSGMFMAEPPTITATAVATVVQFGKYCVISLEDTTTSGLEVTGNGDVDLGCGMATNSRGSKAVDAGGSATVNASPVSAVGGIPDNGAFTDGTTLQQYGMKQEDPYADLEFPSIPNGNCYSVQLNGGKDASSLYTSSGNSGNTSRPAYLNDDDQLRTDVCYDKLILNGVIDFEPGTVVINGGNLDIGSKAVVGAPGNTFYFTTKSNNVTSVNDIGGPVINASAQVTMYPPTTGDYAGILMMQDRRAIDGNNTNNKINGNSSSFMKGSLYFPNQTIEFNGDSGMTTDCVQMVVRRLTISGNATIKNNCETDPGLGGFDGSMIRLVA